MTTRSFPVLATVIIALLPTAATAGQFSAGVAAVDVTPPVPYRMSGYFRERLSTGVLDPLYKSRAFSQE